MKTKTIKKVSFQELLNEAQRVQYTNKEVVDNVEPHEPQEIEFFTLDKWVECQDLEVEAANLGFELAHPYALALYAKEHPDFADEQWTTTQWKDAKGKWCCAIFRRDDVEREVRVYWNDDRWDRDCRFAGVRKSGTKPLDTSASETLSPLNLDSALKLVKENGYKIFKEV